MFAAKGSQDAVSDVSEGGLCQVKSFIAKLIGLNLFFKVTDKLGGYYTFKEFGDDREIADGMIVTGDFFV